MPGLGVNGMGTPRRGRHLDASIVLDLWAKPVRFDG